jgi:hypothetical protein
MTVAGERDPARQAGVHDGGEADVTDVLDRRDAVDERTEGQQHPAPAAADAASVDPIRWGLAALMVGAGAIHAAMVPSHLEASTIEGIGFLAAAWVQLGLPSPWSGPPGEACSPRWWR